MNTLLNNLYQSFQENSARECLKIGDKSYSYAEILSLANKIRSDLRKVESQNIGIHLTHDAEMYAAILAIWFENKTYVAIHPDFPENKLSAIINSAEITTVISSKSWDKNIPVAIIDSSEIVSEISEIPKASAMEDLAYILFTSGSTGEPKGVPVTFENLFYFSDGYNNAFGAIKKEDKVLQMFELTFDMSVVSYLIPWLNGACVVALHRKETKFLQILDLLENDDITVAQMVPSIVDLMLPYLDPEVKNSNLRSVFFAGEPLLAKQIKQWRSFVPNAKIYNAYGPTENTIVCTVYEISEENSLERNGILSIGKQMKHNGLRFENDTENQGELLLSGKMLTKNYWKNPQKTAESFIEIDGVTYYKTGDWCERDSERNYFYKNRIDFQVKINGFRVELSEIEHFANEILEHGISIAMAFKDQNENDHIALFVNDPNCDELQIINYLQQNLPDYMVPTKIIKLNNFPLNASGKTDRKELEKLLV